jgi:hypothetical protein
VAELLPFRVRSAEVFRDGVIVTFADGRCALFSAALLYTSLSQAEDLNDQIADAEDQLSDQGDEAVGGRQ